MAKTLRQQVQEMNKLFDDFAKANGNEMQALRSRVTELEAELGIDVSDFMLKSEYASGAAGVVKASERLISPTHTTNGFDTEGRIIINEV